MKYVIDTVSGGKITVIPGQEEHGRSKRIGLEVNVGGHEGVTLFLELDDETRKELTRAMDMAIGNGSMSLPSFSTHPPGVRG